jgi:hypothetical protein
MIIVSRRAIRFFNFIAGHGFRLNGIALYPFIFLNPDSKITPELINHERIHIRQQMELLVIPFYIWYLYESYCKGYMGNRFEREAYGNEHNLTYLATRKWYSFRKY